MRIQGFHRCAVAHPDIKSKPPALDAATNGMRYTGEGGEVSPEETSRQATGAPKLSPEESVWQCADPSKEATFRTAKRSEQLLRWRHMTPILRTCSTTTTRRLANPSPKPAARPQRRLNGDSYRLLWYRFDPLQPSSPARPEHPNRPRRRKAFSKKTKDCKTSS